MSPIFEHYHEYFSEQFVEIKIFHPGFGIAKVSQDCQIE
jgi:hypothetical protein